MLNNKPMKKKISIIIAFLFGICANLQAQEYKADESIGSQLKNNRVPGALYAPAQQNKPLKNKGFVGSSLAKEMKEGKDKGLPYNTNAVAASNPAKPVKEGKTSSDASTEEMKAENDKTLKTIKDIAPSTAPPPSEKNN